MHNIGFALDGGLRVLLAGLLLGAGLPAVFALGIRAMAWGAGGEAEVSHEPPHPVGRVLAAVCFGVVVVGIALGLTVIIASGMGKELVLDGVVPTLVDE